MPDLARKEYIRTMAATYVALFLVRLAFGVVTVTLPLYIPKVNNSSLALVVSVSPLLELITIVFAGFFIDRYGRKGVLLVGLGLGAVAAYAFSLTQNPFALGGIQALQGIAAAFILVTTLAVLATYAPPEHRGREMGIFNFANVFGIAAGYALGSALLDPLVGRYQYSFVLAGVLATLGLVFANRMIHLPREKKVGDFGDLHPRPSKKALLEAFTNPRILLLILPWLIVFMLVGTLLAYSSRVFTAAGISGGGTSLGILGFGVLLIVAQLFWGRLADKHGREGIMLVGALGFAALMGVVVYAFFTTPAELALTPSQDFAVAAPAEGEFHQEATDASARIDGFAPAQGPPGTQVTFSGSGFKETRSVVFGGMSATFNVRDDKTILATVPAGAQAGPVTITVATPLAVIFDSVMSHRITLIVLLFVGLAFAPAGLAAIADEAKVGTQGATMSAYSLTISLGFILGPLVFGPLSDLDSHLGLSGRLMVLVFLAMAIGLLALVLTRFVQRTAWREVRF